MPNEPKDNGSDGEMLEEYDFSKGTRGKYAERYPAGANVALLDPDVAAIFPDSESVNNALRALAEIIKQHRTDAA